MITVDCDRLEIESGDRVLDVGCGQGRHTFELLRRGATVVSLDLDAEAVSDTLSVATEIAADCDPPGAQAAVRGDANRLPFPDASFDAVVCAETLEHVPTDGLAIGELARVVRPGGRVAITVPRYFPERVCWWLSREYYEVEGGHVRIYRASKLTRRCESAGLRLTARHHAHALHSPYWWVRCLFGAPEEARVSRWYERMLVWDMMNAPTLLGRVERWLDPLLGKSVVLYFALPVDRIGQR